MFSCTLFNVFSLTLGYLGFKLLTHSRQSTGLYFTLDVFTFILTLQFKRKIESCIHTILNYDIVSHLYISHDKVDCYSYLHHANYLGQLLINDNTIHIDCLSADQTGEE